MKVFKPAAPSLVTRVFEYRSRMWMGVSVLQMIGLGSDGPTLEPEQALWTHWATRFESQWPLEEGMPRSGGQYLVSGFAYPHDTDGRGCRVAVQVGAQSKQLLVYGRREWDGRRVTSPEPFTEMPLRWTHAYGGEGVSENPIGMGAVPVGTDGIEVHRLPHIEDPAHPIDRPGQAVRPAGFGPIDPAWAPRATCRGTYDDAWLRNDFPAIASDTDWAFFHTAPQDQQQAQPFVGDEPYAFRNMHPTLPLLQGRLPGLRARAFVTHRVGGEEKFKEVRTRLNTLWFLPDIERAVLVFQGMHEIFEDDGADIVHLLAALERSGQPRPAEHYLAVRDKRLDRENGVLEALREEDLMPADLAVPWIDFDLPKARAFDRSQRRAEEGRAAARDLVTAHGLDPDAGHAPPVRTPPPPEIGSIDDMIRVRREMGERAAGSAARAQAEKAVLVADIRKSLEGGPVDFALIEREMAGLENRGPPKPYAEELVSSFRQQIATGKAAGGDVSELEEMLVDETVQAQWREGEVRQLAGYRAMAHRQPAADALAGEAAHALRQRVIDHRAQGGSLARWDLTGANLAGLDLQGADLSDALLESANLTGTNLNEAKLEGAVLAHATLLGTQLQHARLKGANLGAARIEKADFSRADLTDAAFQDAALREVGFGGATLDGIRLEEAELSGVDFGGAVSKGMLAFVQRDLRACRFAGARFEQCAFVDCNVSGVDFSQAVLGKCTFTAAKADGAVFRGVQLASGCFVQECAMSGADFTDAKLSGTNFRGAVLAGALLHGAALQGCDFSECDMTRADLHRADARQARFVRTRLRGAVLRSANLMDAVFQHALLEDTDYRQANLFQSDFARVRVGANVAFDAALTTRMRTYPRHRPQAAAGSIDGKG